MVKIVVKVGKKSDMQLRNCELHRVITAEEMIITANKIKDCSLIIIEKIKNEEMEITREFIKEYTKNERNHVIFYIEDADEMYASGVADELEYDIIMDRKELYKRIKDITSVDVDITIKRREQSIKEVSSITSDFGILDSVEESNAEAEQVINEESTGNEIECTIEENKADEEAEKLKNDIERYKSMVKELQEEVEDIKRKAHEDKKAEEDASTLRGTIVELGEEIDNLRNSKKQIEEDLEVYKSAVDERVERIKELNKEIEDFTSRVAEIEGINKALEERVQETEGERDTALQEIKELECSIKDSSNKVDKLEKEKEELENKVSSVSKELEEVEREAKNKEEAIREETRQTINTLMNDKDTLDEDNKKLKEKIAELESRGHRDSNGVRIEYTGKAKIISVYGVGSYGVSATAFSLWHKLGTSAKVLFIDMDLTSPNLDGMLVKSPYSTDRTIRIEQQYRTGLGVFMKKGFNQFMQCTDLVRELNSNSISKMDYIHGVYGRLGEQEIADAEYTEWLNYLGGKYDYIIIDNGKVGESEAKDSLISKLVEVAYRSICVINGSTKVRINNSINRVRCSGVKIENSLLLMNMCVSSGMSEVTKNIVKGIRCKTMEIEQSMVCNSKPNFNNSKLTKERFDSIIDEYIND